jgi:hypothetical protein
MRVFFLTSTPPIPTWGGAMAFYRHFVEQKGFEIAVATDYPGMDKFKAPYEVTTFETPPWLKRIQKTRLSQWAHGFQHLYGGRNIPLNVLTAAKRFKPDLILTIGGSWTWSTDMAWQLSRRLKVPLVGSFNDWFDYGTICHPALKPMLEARFREFYRSCGLALCTCEGMKEALGQHRNALLHYPAGARLTPAPANPGSPGPFRVLFGGNLGDWYGRMLEELVTAARQPGNPEIEFVFFGSNPSWSAEFDTYARAEGIFRGQVPFERLRHEAFFSDCLLLPMGFDEKDKQVESTSFKTKFLDYLAFQRPIMVWGPDYSSAVKTAREFDSAQVCTSPNAAECLSKLLSLSQDKQRQAALMSNAGKMYEARFNPDKIHQTFLYACQDLVEH